MSAPEFHAAVKRLPESGLIEHESRKPVEALLFHGVFRIFSRRHPARQIAGFLMGIRETIIRVFNRFCFHKDVFLCASIQH